MKLVIIIFFLFILRLVGLHDAASKMEFDSDQKICQALNFMKLKNKSVQDNFFNHLDSIRKFQYPENNQETEIMVDLNQMLLNQFLKDIKQVVFSKTGRFEKEYYFDIAPEGYRDNETCKDKISIEFNPKSCRYQMVIHNTFLVEPNWCTESQVIYSFEIKGDRIINFSRNEAG